MYANGQGALNYKTKAVKWYLKAAQQGFTKAQYNLGLMYFKGEGVPQYYKKAYSWFALAAMDGHKKALKNRDIVADKLSPSGLEQAQEEAEKLNDKINSQYISL
ncbi:MAG: sel1 repeat family protein [Colwellia sp.]|nr:sel1 repeat family protein [Colwellia sp.]